MDLRGIAVAWFRKEDWTRWRSIDPDFEPDYDYWLSRAESAMRQTSQPLHKVIIDPDQFLEWSRANGGKIDTKARATYAAIVLSERDRRQAH